MDWKTILTAWGGAAILPLILGYLFREWISTRLRRSIEHEYDTKLEGFKAGYKKILDENQIRFSRFYSEQADVIKELHKLLSKLKLELNNLTTGFKVVPEDKEERREYEAILKNDVVKAYNPCSEYFLANKIFLPEALCSKIGSFLSASKEAFYEYSVAGDELHKATLEMKRGARKKVEDLEEILTELQAAFRAILNGDNPEEVENE